jgi:hypothetical protein
MKHNLVDLSKAIHHLLPYIGMIVVAFIFYAYSNIYIEGWLTDATKPQRLFSSKWKKITLIYTIAYSICFTFLLCVFLLAFDFISIGICFTIIFGISFLGRYNAYQSAYKSKAANDKFLERQRLAEEEKELVKILKERYLNE